jgi:hypothetical protein
MSFMSFATAMAAPSRRRLLIAGVAAAGVALAGAAPGEAEALRAGLASLVRDPESYRRIGLAYRRANPSACDPGGLPPFLAGLPVAERRRWFIERCRRDFAEGKVELVDGWLFAASELRLAVLLAT